MTSIRSFVITFTLMMLVIVYLSGCAGKVQHGTGYLTCFGYCQMLVENTAIEAGTEIATGIHSGTLQGMTKEK